MEAARMRPNATETRGEGRHHQDDRDPYAPDRVGVRAALRLVAGANRGPAALAALLQLASTSHESRRSSADHPPCHRGQSRETSQLALEAASERQPGHDVR